MRLMTGPSNVSGNTNAPTGTLGSFAEEQFSHDGVTHDIYRKGSGPAVIVMTEMPGISPMVLGFADRVAALGCTAVLPQMFGTPGRDPFEGNKLNMASYTVGSIGKACISKEFSVFALGKSSPIVDWLRALAANEHDRCGGPGVGAVGMCFTGGFALAMAVDARVLAPVLSQPSLPFGVSKRHRYNIDCSAADLEIVAGRCANEGLRVLGLRFKGDTFVPEERFQFLKDRLGTGFVAVELEQHDGNPNSQLSNHHSVLTGDLIDEAGQPTRAALDAVLALFQAKLVSPS